MSGMNGRGSSSNSALIESLISGDRQGVGGILCNDPHGLCLASKGATSLSSPSSDSGVFTNLVHLAAQLQQNNSPATAAAGADGATPAQTPPLITLETSDKAILVKDYAGFAVAVQIPKRSANADSEASQS